MAKLQLIFDGKIINEYQLTRSRLRIGRRRGSDILLDHPAVSGDHALVERVGRDLYLEDRESTNGTKLNGKPIRRQRLRVGDEIGIARYTLRCISDEVPAEAGFDRTLMVIESNPGGGKVDTRIASVNKKPAASSEGDGQTIPSPLGELLVLSGAGVGKTLLLTKNQTTVGKVGFQVAVVTRCPHGYFLAQIEGETALKVNGKDIGTEPHLLEEGDLIQIMGIHMAYSAKK